MRLADLRDYFLLRRHLRDPRAFLRMRKHPPGGPFHDLRFWDGTQLRIRPGTQDRHIFHRIFGRDEYQVGRLPPGSLGTVIDIGAHIGIFAVRVAPLATRILSFEPDPANIPLLLHNVARLPGIIPVSRAVAGQRGPAVYFPAPDPSAGSLFPGEVWPAPIEEKSRTGISVDCLTLAEVFEEHRIERCGLLKLDCEGAEHQILRSVPPELWRRIERIRLEYHPAGMDSSPGERQPAATSLLALLAAAGFEARPIPRKKKPDSGRLIAWRRGLGWQ